MSRAMMLSILLATSAGVRAQDCFTLSRVESIGTGTSGTAGVPQLVIVGHAAIGEPKPALRVEGGLHQGLAQIVVGTIGTGTALPLYDATLYVGTPFTRWLVPLDAQGASAPLGGGDGPLPASFCDLEFAAQALVLDPQAKGGAAFSAALALRFGLGSGARALFDGMFLDASPAGIASAMEVADLDDNGLPDVVAPSGGGNSRIDVFYQLEDGGFAKSQSAGLGLFSRDLDVGDFDRDGRLDAVVLGDSAQRKLGVAFGQPDGSLGPLVTLASGSDDSPPTGLELADMDGDGWLDAVTLDWVIGSVGVHLSQSGAALALPLLQPVGLPTFARSFTVADVDLDGHSDVLVLAGSPTDRVAILYGLGGGTLALPITVPIGVEGANGLAVADALGDSRPDILVTVEGSSVFGIHASLRLFENRGTGFALPTILQEESDPLATYSGLVLADMDEDGTDDILVPGNASPFLTFPPTSVLHVQSGLSPGGAWSTEPSYAGSGVYFRAVDVDDDGHVDLLSDTGFYSPSQAMIVQHGQGEGTFDVPPSSPPELSGFPSATGDFDENGRADVAVLDVNSIAAVRIGLGTIDALLLPADSIPLPGYVRAITAADLDANGHLDLAIATSGFSLAIVLGHGDGSFAPAVEILPPPGTHFGAFVAAADIDGDAILDLISAINAGSDSTIQVLLGTGGASFGAPVLTTLAPGLSSNMATLADVDGDGRADVVFTGKGNGGLYVAFAAGGGAFDAPTFVASADPALFPGPPVGDVDGDGDLDVIIRAPDVLHVRTALNDGTGQFELLPAVLNSGTQTRLADVNGDGRLDLLGQGVALGFGDGRFASPDLGLPYGEPADVDGDGDLDLTEFGAVWENHLH